MIRHARIQGDITLHSPSALSFIGEYKGGASQTPHSIPLLPFTSCRANDVSTFPIYHIE